MAWCSGNTRNRSPAGTRSQGSMLACSVPPPTASGMPCRAERGGGRPIDVSTGEYVSKPHTRTTRRVPKDATPLCLTPPARPHPSDNSRSTGWRTTPSSVGRDGFDCPRSPPAWRCSSCPRSAARVSGQRGLLGLNGASPLGFAVSTHVRARIEHRPALHAAQGVERSRLIRGDPPSAVRVGRARSRQRRGGARHQAGEPQRCDRRRPPVCLSRERLRLRPGRSVLMPSRCCSRRSQRCASRSMCAIRAPRSCRLRARLIGADLFERDGGDARSVHDCFTVRLAGRAALLVSARSGRRDRRRLDCAACADHLEAQRRRA